mgnify:CR=1 FL=1
MTAAELKSLRKSLGMSVDACAAQVFVASRTWARYESGTKRIPGGVVELFRIKNAGAIAAMEGARHGD